MLNVGTINIAGSFFKSGGSTTSTTVGAGWTFNNTGFVYVSSGTLNISGGGSASGAFTADFDTVLSFNAPYTLNLGATLDGQGTYTINNTTLTIAGDSSITNVTQANGTLSGAGNLSIGGYYDWTSGTISGSGATNVDLLGTLDSNGSSAKTLSAHTINVNDFGSMYWSGSGSITTNSATAGTINISSGGYFEVQSDGTIFTRAAAGNLGVVNNDGSFVKMFGLGTATIGAGWTFNNTGSIEVNKGTLSFSTSGALSNSGSISVASGCALVVTGPLAGAAGTIDASGNLTAGAIRQHALTLSGSAVATIGHDGTSAATSTLDSLSISGSAKLNLTNNKLIVHGTPVGTWNGSTYTGSIGLLASGRNGGSWNGAGIMTSESNAITPRVLTTLAIATGDQTGYAGGTFGGQSAASGDALIMYTWGGDANLSGFIDGDDYFQIDSHVGLNGSAFGYFNGDFNYDGAIDGDDYFIIDSNIGAQGMPFPPSPVLSPVPEPSVGFLSIFLLLCRRRLKR